MRPDPIIAMSLTLARAEHRSYLSNARDSLIPELTAYWLEHAARARRHIAELKPCL